jgi:hypothetical protein
LAAAEDITGYQTTELALAAFLTMSGYEHLGFCMVNHRSAAWIFVEDEDIYGLVEKFHAHEAEVEPREFMRRLSEARTELFKFLDGDQ